MQAAAETENEGDQHQESRRGQHAAGADGHEQQHRDGDGGEIESGSSGQHPSDQEHRPGRPHGARPEPAAQQFVNRGHALGVEFGHEDAGDHEGRDEGGDVGAEIGEVPAIAVVRPAEEGRRGLGGRQHGDGREPGRHGAAGEEIIAGVVGAAPIEPE